MIINPYNTTSTSTSGGNIQIGFGTTFDVRYPSYFNYNYSVSAFIYSPTELSLVSGKFIYKIEFEMKNDFADCVADNQILSLAHYTSSGFPSTLRANLTTSANATIPITGLTKFTAVKNSSWPVRQTSTNETIWLGLDFTTSPFEYDGTKYLIIHWLSNDGSYIVGTGSNPKCLRPTTGPTNSAFSLATDSAPITTNIVTANSQGRPNIKIYWL